MTPAQDVLSARDLLALQAFELAARTGSFKAAAEALHLTASAVSHRIAGLERTLGARLFERGPRGVVLSPAGNALAATTGHAFGDLSRALARQSPDSRRLRVSAVPIFASHWLLPRLGRFLADHPEIELQVEASPRMADMEAGLVDVALRYGEGQWPGVSAERIMDLETVPVAAPALVRRLKLATPADLVRAPLIRVSPFGASWTDWATAAGLDARRFERRKGMQVDGMGAALRAATHGLGVALAFDPVIDSEVRSGALARVGPGVTSRGQIWLACRPRERNMPAIRALRSWLLAESGTA
ncbi:MAG: LysR family transcriptional regulator [Rhodospirillales bacterium]|nr:LysR family transcriptional regulator [Rhodospirillales bacterium]